MRSFCFRHCDGRDGRPLQRTSELHAVGSSAHQGKAPYVPARRAGQWGSVTSPALLVDTLLGQAIPVDASCIGMQQAGSPNQIDQTVFHPLVRTI